MPDFLPDNIVNSKIANLLYRTVMYSICNVNEVISFYPQHSGQVSQKYYKKFRKHYQQITSKSMKKTKPDLYIFKFKPELQRKKDKIITHFSKDDFNGNNLKKVHNVVEIGSPTIYDDWNELITLVNKPLKEIKNDTDTTIKEPNSKQETNYFLCHDEHDNEHGNEQITLNEFERTSQPYYELACPDITPLTEEDPIYSNYLSHTYSLPSNDDSMFYKNGEMNEEKQLNNYSTLGESSTLTPRSKSSETPRHSNADLQGNFNSEGEEPVRNGKEINDNNIQEYDNNHHNNNSPRRSISPHDSSPIEHSFRILRTTDHNLLKQIERVIIYLSYSVLSSSLKLGSIFRTQGYDSDCSKVPKYLLKDTPFTTEVLGDIFGFGKFYIHRLFHNYTGITIKSYEMLMKKFFDQNKTLVGNIRDIIESNRLKIDKTTIYHDIFDKFDSKNHMYWDVSKRKINKNNNNEDRNSVILSNSTWNQSSHYLKVPKMKNEVSSQYNTDGRNVSTELYDNVLFYSVEDNEDNKRKNKNNKKPQKTYRGKSEYEKQQMANYMKRVTDRARTSTSFIFANGEFVVNLSEYRFEIDKVFEYS